MGKRSSFERRPRDAYDTPIGAVEPLLCHLPAPYTFSAWEPCAGSGNLLMAIPASYWAASDIEPRAPNIKQADALGPQPSHRTAVDYIITNPPWARPILHAMIERFSEIAPTWLLFDADWAHTKQAIPFANRCRKIVSIGRVKWIEDSKHTGKDNCAWYLFDKPSRQKTEFYFRNG